MVVLEFFFFHFAHELDRTRKLDIAKPRTAFEQCTEYLVFLVKGKVMNVRSLTLTLESKLINPIKLIVKNPYRIGPRLKNIVLSHFPQVHNFLHRIVRPCINDLRDFVLV